MLNKWPGNVCFYEHKLKRREKQLFTTEILGRDFTNKLTASWAELAARGRFLNSTRLELPMCHIFKYFKRFWKLLGKFVCGQLWSKPSEIHFFTTEILGRHLCINSVVISLWKNTQWPTIRVCT